MPDYSIDMINYAVDQKPNDFVKAFNDQMHAKVVDVITKYKEEIAKSYFNSEDEKDQQQDSEQETENQEQEQQDTEDETDENSEANT